MPAIASACCCASAPASVTGDMAPASVKGVITLHLAMLGQGDQPFGHRNVELQRRVGVDDAGEDRRVGQSSSRVVPSEIAAISSPSMARSRPRPCGCQFLSSSVISA